MRRPLALMIGMVATAFATSAPAADFVTVRKKIQVERTAAEVWDVVGDFCSIRDWLKRPCEITTGALANDSGAVRKLGEIEEVMIGRGPTWYSYFLSVGPAGATHNHGVVEVRPEQGRRSTIVYTIVYDQSVLPDAAAKADKNKWFNDLFQSAVESMKALAEARR